MLVRRRTILAGGLLALGCGSAETVTGYASVPPLWEPLDGGEGGEVPISMGAGMGMGGNAGGGAPPEGDNAPPALLSAVINSAGTLLTLTYDEELDASSEPATNAYSLVGTTAEVTGVDVSGATVITLYLLSSSNLKLRPILTRQLKPGARIVAHNFAMGDWEAEKVETFTDQEGRTRTIYRWTADGRVRQ